MTGYSLIELGLRSLGRSLLSGCADKRTAALLCENGYPTNVKLRVVSVGVPLQGGQSMAHERNV